MTALLVLLAIAFAMSLGAHYTGACMGMPLAFGAVNVRQATLLMAPLAFLGAAFASGRVEQTAGTGLVSGPGLSVLGFVVVIAVAFALTSAFNVARLPTSTIQILVFSVVGAALGVGLDVHWAAILLLLSVWICAPAAAALLGYTIACAIDHTSLLGTGRGRRAVVAGGLMLVGAFASFTMGANDVANATGSLVGTRTFSPLIAGVVGGAAMAIGVLSWGRPLLTRVAFDVAELDPQMAVAAQMVQGVVVFSAVAFGFFTSMNQALVAAMLGASACRGRHVVKADTARAVLRGWFIGPASGVTLAFCLARALSAGIGVHTLTA